MPVYPCAWPTCREYVPKRGRHCPAHEQHGRDGRRDRDRLYDRQRDPEAVRFYASAAWQRCRATVLAADPVCRRCRREWARDVHHVKPLERCTPAEKLAPRNLRPLCGPCHNIEEAEIATTGA